MKKLFIVVLFVTLPITTSAAFLSGGTDVGQVDTFLAQANKVGSTDAEADWASGVIGTNVDWTVKLANVSYEETTTLGVYAFDVLLDPGYFLVKNATHMALFKNLDNLDWGVFDSDSFSAGINIPSSGFTISHVTSLVSVGGDPRINRNVPEPVPIALLGAGLIGLGYTRKVTGK